jgi:hypothetical protein
VFASYEQLLFSRVVALAEKAGKKVHLLVVPSSTVFDAVVQTAIQIESSEIIAGVSSVLAPIDQARAMGDAWERAAHKPPHPLPFRVVHPGGRVQEFNLGAHAPRLTAAEIEVLHDLWLDLSQREGLKDLHHHEVVAAALARFVRDMKQGKQAEVLRELRAMVQGPRREPDSGPPKGSTPVAPAPDASPNPPSQQ